MDLSIQVVYQSIHKINDRSGNAPVYIVEKISVAKNVAQRG